MGYEASDQVSSAHNIPHLDFNFNQQSNEFSISMDYLMSLLPLPALVLGICILLVFGYIFAICCACCCRIFCRCLKCCSYQNEVSDSNSTNIERLKHHARIVRIFIALLIILFIFDFFVWYGGSEITNSFNSFMDGLNDISNFFSQIMTIAVAQISNSDEFTNTLSSSTCSSYSASSGLSSVTQSISSASSTMKTISSTIVDAINQTINLIPNYTSIKNTAVGSLFSIILFIIICFSCALYFSKKWLFRFSIGFTWVIVTILFVISSAEMALVMLLADFCIDPSANILNILTSSTFNYYLTCTGSNPFASSFSTLSSSLDSMETQLTSAFSAGAMTQSCYDSLLQTETDISSQNSALSALIGDCTAVNKAYDNIVLQAVCTSGFSAIFLCWIFQFVIAVLLYLVMAFADVVFHTYVVDRSTMRIMSLDNIVNIEGNKINSTGPSPTYSKVPSKNNKANAVANQQVADWSAPL